MKYKLLILGLSTLLIGLPINTVLIQILVINFGFPVYVALWKELVAFLIMCGCGWELIGACSNDFLTRKSDKEGDDLTTSKDSLYAYLPVILVFLMTLVGVLASLGRVSWTYILYGFRFELFWVWFWAILVTYSQRFFTPDLKYKHSTAQSKMDKLSILRKSMLWGFGLSSTLSLTTILFGTEKLLGWLGYGKTLVGFGSDLYIVQPVGHLVDAGGWNNNFRLSSGFSSPNHYAVYLILLLPLFLYKVFGRLNLNLKQKFFWILGLVLGLVFIILTYSRFSYLVLFVFLTFFVVLQLQKTRFKLSLWVKNAICSITLLVPLLIVVVVLNLPISLMRNYLPTFLAKPSSTEWHQQHTFASWRAITLQTHPQALDQSKLSLGEKNKLEHLVQDSNRFDKVMYRIFFGYGMGTTDPASKYLPPTSNPIVNLGFGLDDELFFPRVFERPLALTPENWFLGLWVKGGIFYMLIFIAILVYFMRDLRYWFQKDLTTIFNSKVFLQALFSLSIFGLCIAGFLLDIFDSQSLALLISPIYLVYMIYDM